MMVVSVLLMSDSVIAGALIGADAAMGITLVTPIYSLSAFFGSVFSLGVPIVYSTEMGKFNKEGADRAFGFGLLMSLAVGITLFVLISIFGDSYLQSCNPSASVLGEASGYLSWMRFTILVLPLQMLIAAVVYGDGDETLSTAANGVQGLGNLAASVLLCHAMGIRGIGMASFIFNVVALLILLGHFFKKSNSLRWNLFFSGELFGKVARYSIIDAGSYLFLAIFTAAMNAFVSVRFGPEFLIIVSAVALCRELQMVFDGIGEAVTPIFGIYLGEGCHSGVRKIYRLAEKSAVAEGIAVTAVLVICAQFVPSILNITDQAIAGCTVMCVRFTALGSVFVSLLYLLTSYYVVIEKIALGLAISAMRDCVPAVILAAAFGFAFGLYGLFIGLAVAPAIAYGLSLLYVSGRYGREDCPLLLSRVPCEAKAELFDLSTEPEQIIGLQKEVEALLVENGVGNRTVGRVKLLIEELYMLIREKNGGKAVLSECAVYLKPEGVQIVTKDEGVLFDISEDDVEVTSIGAFAVSAYMEKLGQNRHYLKSISFNRSSFLIKVDK